MLSAHWFFFRFWCHNAWLTFFIECSLLSLNILLVNGPLSWINSFPFHWILLSHPLIFRGTVFTVLCLIEAAEYGRVFGKCNSKFWQEFIKKTPKRNHFLEFREEFVSLFFSIHCLGMAGGFSCGFLLGQTLSQMNRTLPTVALGECSQPLWREYQRRLNLEIFQSQSRCAICHQSKIQISLPKERNMSAHAQMQSHIRHLNVPPIPCKTAPPCEEDQVKVNGVQRIWTSSCQGTSFIPNSGRLPPQKVTPLTSTKLGFPFSISLR